MPLVVPSNDTVKTMLYCSEDLLNMVALWVDWLLYSSLLYLYIVQDNEEEEEEEDDEERMKVAKAGDANLDELEQMLREKALKSLKEAKQLLADDGDT